MPKDISLTDDARRIQSAIVHFLGQMNHPVVHTHLRKQVDAFDKIAVVIVRTIRNCPDSPLRLTDLADRLGVELSTVSRKINHLEKLGFIERSDDPSDARASHISITSKGERLLAEVDACYVDITKHVVARWPHQNRKQFAELLELFALSTAEHLKKEDHS